MYSLLSFDEAIAKIKNKTQSYFAFYSSWLGGIVTHPGLMTVPVDDHMVHRGDGVFEAMKYIYGRVYLLEDHLLRLEQSAKAISLNLPMSLDEISQVIHQMVKVSGQEKMLIRLFVSRGPGGFSPSPYEPPSSQLYIVTTHFRPVPEYWLLQGVTIGKSQVPAKDPWLARVKSCNYLHNVMMKKESVDRKIDFTVGYDHSGQLTEGSTENIVVLTKEGVLAHSALSGILKGTTMTRLFDLVEKQGLLPTGRGVSLTEKDVLEAKELMMVGTTLDVVPVREYEGRPITVGPWAAQLNELLKKDQKSNL